MGSPSKYTTPHRTNICSPGQEDDSPLPPIQERLAYLRPSRELLEFYRQKIAQYDAEHEELLQMLEKYKGVTEDQHKLQCDTRRREEENTVLQNALSDMQVCLFQEREQSLRLYAENDRLKIRELEDRKKIQHLLALVGPDAGEVTYFHQEPPRKVTVTQRQLEPRLGENLNLRPTKLRPTATTKEFSRRTKPAGGLKKENLEQYKNENQTLLLQVEALRAQMEEQTRLGENLNLRPTKLRPTATTKEFSRRTKPSGGLKKESLEQYKNENQTLLLQVEALRAQMEEQTRLAKEQVEALLEDRKIKTEEAQAQQQRDQERIKSLTEKLQQTQNLLHESTSDFLQLKFNTRAQEKSWMVEKDRLLRELDSCHTRLRKTRSSGAEQGKPWQPGSSGRAAHLLPRQQPELDQQHKEQLKVVQEDLKQAHRLAEMYREQCITLETDLSQIREEGDVSREIFKERSDKMAKRLQLMTQRYEALEKRRAMEVEGFKTDLKQLRQKLKDVEKQLLKVTLNIGPNQDLAVLHEVRQTSSRTRKVQSELMALKAKIYGLENELRFS